MAAVAFGLLFAGYGVSFWGWTLVKGYDISVSEIFIPGKYTGAWPPPVTKFTAGGGLADIGKAIGSLATAPLKAGAKAVQKGLGAVSGAVTPNTAGTAPGSAPQAVKDYCKAHPNDPLCAAPAITGKP